MVWCRCVVIVPYVDPFVVSVVVQGGLEQSSGIGRIVRRDRDAAAEDGRRDTVFSVWGSLRGSGFAANGEAVQSEAGRKVRHSQTGRVAARLVPIEKAEARKEGGES